MLGRPSLAYVAVLSLAERHSNAADGSDQCPTTTATLTAHFRAWDRFTAAIRARTGRTWLFLSFCSFHEM